MTRIDAFSFIFKKNEENPSMLWGNHKTIRIAHDELLHSIFDYFEQCICITCEYKIVDTFYNLHRCKKIKMIDTYDETLGCTKWKQK